MIQIQRREQFTDAAARLRKEHMSVRLYEPRLYEVTNKAKGHTYHVRIERKGGKTFGTCTCEAGNAAHGQARADGLQAPSGGGHLPPRALLKKELDYWYLEDRLYNRKLRALNAAA